MKITVAISGTPSVTVKNAARCPDWVACSDRPKASAAAKPSSRRDAHARPATSAMLVTSTARVKTIPFTGTGCAASIASFPGGSHTRSQ
jgi:hypothetical protein